MKWKLKKNSDGSVALNEEGFPIWVNEKGEERGYDVERMFNKIGELNAEAKGHREARESAESKLKAFEGLDPAVAKDAVNKIQSIQDKKLFESGEVDKLKEGINQTWQTKFDAEVAARTKAEKDLHNERIGGSFTRSKFIAEKLIVPADLVQAQFGKHFQIVDGKIVATDANGNKILSNKSPGEIAEFDEAMEILVQSYPHRARITKSDQQPGSGNRGQGGGSNQTSISRAQFETMNPAQRADHFAKGGTLHD